MDQQVGVKVKIDVLRTRLSQEHGRILSHEDVFAILRSFGMKQQDDVWILDSPTDLTYIEKDEIEAIGKAVSDGTGRWAVELAPMSATMRKIMTETVRCFQPSDREPSRLDGSAAESVCVPRAFVGDPRSVRQRGASLIRKVVKQKDWSVAHNPAEMIRFAEVSGDIYLHESMCSGSGNNVLLYMVPPAVFEATRQNDRRQWYDLQKQIILSGMDYVWFCLATMNAQYWLIDGPSSDAERSSVAYVAIQKLLVHWPTLCALDNRIVDIASRGWPCWCTRVATLACYLGATRATLNVMRQSDVVTVGKMLQDILAASTTTGDDTIA